MKKQTTAFFAAFIISAIVAASMLVVGVDAATNKNGVTASNSPSTPAVQSVSSSNGQDQVAQLQSLVSQYQAREQQYQAREQQYQATIDSYNQQLSQASQEVQVVEQLLTYLQNRGLIRINKQGQISVTSNSNDSGN
jgi:hypothetical protein